MFGDDPNAETVVNKNGGKQSAIPVRMDLIPPRELLELGRILKLGADKYGEWNWLKIGVNDHLNHALHHIYAFLNRTEEKITFDEKHYTELMHAFCRLLFAATKYRVSNDVK